MTGCERIKTGTMVGSTSIRRSQTPITARPTCRGGKGGTVSARDSSMECVCCEGGENGQQRCQRTTGYPLDATLMKLSQILSSAGATQENSASAARMRPRRSYVFLAP